MCFACTNGGFWPWGQRPTHIAPPPVKEEIIYLDADSGFYPDYRTGIHPPGPVYQNNTPSQPGLWPYGYGQQWPPGVAPQGYGTYPCQNPFQPQAPAYGFYGSYTYPAPEWPPAAPLYPHFPNTQSPSWYSIHYPPAPSQTNSLPIFSLCPVPGQPMVFAQPTCPQSMTAQAAAAAAANAALAQSPSGPSYFVGGSPADIQAQQAIIAAQMGQPAPSSLAPYKPSDGQQFWCKELDGAWTLRTYSDIALGDVSPGHWERHAVSGYFFWVRQAM